MVDHHRGRRPLRRHLVSLDVAEPLLHPDDIVIDMNTGQVIVKGPMTKEEKVVWDRLRARLDEIARSRNSPPCSKTAR